VQGIFPALICLGYVTFDHLKVGIILYTCHGKSFCVIKL